MAWHGMAQHGMAQHGMAWHSTTAVLYPKGPGLQPRCAWCRGWPRQASRA